VTDYSHVVADKNRGQCAFGQDARAQKYRVNLSCGKSCSGSTSIGNRVQLSLLFWLSVLDKNSAMKIDYLYTYFSTLFFLFYSIHCAPTTETFGKEKL
jgi:hypothetical protein